MVVRLRYHLHVQKRGEDSEPLLAEEVRTIAFHGDPESPQWLADDDAKHLLDCSQVAIYH